jgi:hypothetical protein
MRQNLHFRDKDMLPVPSAGGFDGNYFKAEWIRIDRQRFLALLIQQSDA